MVFSHLPYMPSVITAAEEVAAWQDFIPIARSFRVNRNACYTLFFLVKSMAWYAHSTSFNRFHLCHIRFMSHEWGSHTTISFSLFAKKNAYVSVVYPSNCANRNPLLMQCSIFLSWLFSASFSVSYAFSFCLLLKDVESSIHASLHPCVLQIDCKQPIARLSCWGSIPDHLQKTNGIISIHGFPLCSRKSP